MLKFDGIQPNASNQTNMKKLILFLIFFFPIIALSQTTIQESDVSGTWTLSGSPYLIEGDVTIEDTDTLVIEPGVIVEFQDYYGLFVEGYLHAIGNETDSILFTVNDTTGYHDYSHAGWKGIRFNNTTPYDSSYVEYCIIEYGKGYGKVGGGMYIRLYDKIRITNSTIKHCFVDGVDWDDGGGGITIFSSCVFIRDLTIEENHSNYHGGGLFIANLEVDAKRITIRNNSAVRYGGGIYSIAGNEYLYDIEISNNIAGSGGGIWSESELYLIDSEVHGNSATEGGGIYFNGQIEIYNTNIYNNNATKGGGIYANSENHVDSKITECNIYNNNSEESGGGIYMSSYCFTLLQNSTIDSNYSKFGGGIFMRSWHADFAGLSIKNNYSYYGGGIYIDLSYPNTFNMDSINLCSIYNNNGKVGKDLFSEEQGMEIIVDTFTVQNPSDYYSMPAKNFSFDISNSLSTLVNDNYYISPNGSDQNSGMSNNDPFKTINHALSVLYTDDQNPATIYIDNGIYSPSLTGELYPLITLNNLTIGGLANSILDTDSSERILYSYGAKNQIFYNLTIRNGKINEPGGGIYLNGSKAQFDSITIYNCISELHGGGIYLKSDSVQFDNTNISNCMAKSGGGIFTYESDADFSNMVVTNNTAENYGGGIWIGEYECQINLNNVSVSNNMAKRGGGIQSSGGFPDFKNVSIFENSADEYGGGIYIYSEGIIFDTTYLSSIYSNTATIGNDLYNNGDSIIHVVVDTFTVLNPTAYYAKPVNLFTFDINSGLVDQISDNIYLSPDGDDNNSGLSWNEPLKTIKHSFSIAASNESSPLSMHLGPGIYSEETNDETFPIRPIDYLNVIGYNEVTIDADSLSSVIEIIDLQNVTLENLQLQNGYAKYGGGINIEDSQIVLSELILIDNTSTNRGGGINAENSLLTFNDLLIKNNKSLQFSGAIMVNKSMVDITNSIIDSNQSSGSCIVASFSYLNIIGSQITNNFNEGIALYYTTANIINTTLSGNTIYEYWSGAILAYDSVDLKVKNCIFWGDPDDWDIFARGDDYITNLTISGTSLTEGENSIGIQGDVELKYGLNNISGDPGFLGYGDYPYQLDEYSPCINTANIDTTGLNLPPFDLAGNPRINFGRIDIGAFEWGPFVNIEYPGLKDEESFYTIYPNPAKNNLTISTKNKETIAEVIIYNQLGQKILNSTYSDIINVSKLEQGIYIIEIVTKRGKVREKLIIH